MELNNVNIDYIWTFNYNIWNLVHRIIITGGSGFIGRHLAKRLLSDKGNDIVLLSNTPNLQEKFLAQRRLLQDMPITFHTADIRDRESITSNKSN